MSVINFDGVSLAFGAETIFEGITFGLNEGDRLGIVGANGAGKSSLMKIVTGEYEATSGQVYIAKNASVGMLRQDAAPDGDATLLDEACQAFPELLAAEKRLEELRSLSLEDGEASARYAAAIEAFARDGGYEFRGRCVGVLKNLGFSDEDLTRRVSTLSGGQKTRLALGCLLLRDPDILILDEPTNHLDASALTWLEKQVRNSRKTVLVISHDRYFLDAATNKTLEIENGRAKLYDGSYSEFVKKKAADREIQERHYKNQQKEIARIEAYIEQQRRWNREKNIIAAESREKQLAKMERVERPDALPKGIRMSFTSSGESGEDALILRRLSKAYHREKPLFDNVSIVIKKGERVFITGPNGCGKSTLIKCIAGRIDPDRGETEYGAGVVIGYYDQENQELNPNNTVLDEVWDDYADMNLTAVRNALAQFRFCGDDVMKRVSTLSGGEKARLTMTKLVLSKMNVLILDEPTNHLDISSREALEEALLNFDGTIISVSHDRYFVKKLATRMIAFDGTPGLYDYRGGYDDFTAYMSKKEAESKADTVQSKLMTDSKEKFIASKQAQAEQRRLEKQLKNTEKRIAEAEARITEIDDEMNGSASSNAARLVELSEEKERLEEELLGLYEIIMQ